MLSLAIFKESMSMTELNPKATAVTFDPAIRVIVKVTRNLAGTGDAECNKDTLPSHSVNGWKIS